MNNAGLMFDQLTATWDDFLAVNFMGVIHASNGVLPYLWEQRSGSIVNISSNAAFPLSLPMLFQMPDGAPAPTLAPEGYGMTKWMIIRQTKTMAQLLGSRNIRVNAVCPGVTMSAGDQGGRARRDRRLAGGDVGVEVVAGARGHDRRGAVPRRRRELQDERPGAHQRRRHLDRQRVTATEVIDPDVLQGWLSDAIGQPIERVELELLPQGHANGAWRIVATIGTGPAESTRRMVLKAPRQPSIVHDLDPCREARGGRRVGSSRCAGALRGGDRSGHPGGRSPVLRHGMGRRSQRARRLAERVPRRLVPRRRRRRAACHVGLVPRRACRRAPRRPRRTGDRLRRTARRVDVLGYWRAALLAVIDQSVVPRHLAVFDWLADNVPPSAEAPPALCMGDARLVNAIVDGADVAALVDFEVAYVGNPIGDIGYSLFLERSHGHTAPLPGLPSEDETWARWSAATGRGSSTSTTGWRSPRPSSSSPRRGRA